jgi:peptidyl-prolyl cis-trans isomerase D
MLRILRGGQRWLTAILVIGIGTVFVVFLGLQGPLDFASSQQIVKVGPLEFGIDDFERVRERRQAAIESELGDQFDARAMREALDNLAARELVDTALLALAAEDLGLRVTTGEIERLVLAEPGFRDDGGRFDRELFQQFVERNYGSQKAFMDERRLSILSLKMLSLTSGLAEVSEGEAREAARRDLEEAQIAFAVIASGPAGQDVEIGKEDIEAAVANRAEEIAQRYEQQSELYNRPERVRARHILRTLEPGAAPEEVDRVRKEVEAAAARIQAGETFEAVAQELSQDPGSQASGGDLGFFARGQMVKGFEDAAFALAPGQMSGPVQTDFGFHLIRVEERQEAVSRPLEAVREEVATDLLREEKLREAARAKAAELAEAIRSGQSLQDAVRERGVPLRRSGSITRRAVFIPGLGNSPELVAAAFVLEPGASSPQIFEVPGGFALVEVLERKGADPEKIEATVAAKRDELLQAKRNERVDAWLRARRDALTESGDLVVNLEPIRG